MKCFNRQRRGACALRFGGSSCRRARQAHVFDAVAAVTAAAGLRSGVADLVAAAGGGQKQWRTIREAVSSVGGPQIAMSLRPAKGRNVGSADGRRHSLVVALGHFYPEICAVADPASPHGCRGVCAFCTKTARPIYITPPWQRPLSRVARSAERRRPAFTVGPPTVLSRVRSAAQAL